MGARTGEKIFIYPYDHPEPNGGLIPLIFISHQRTIRVDGHFDNVLVVSRVSKTDMGPQLAFHKCVVPENAQRKGLATWMLSEQVVAARISGFEKIVD
jgi:hypothetical protein